jgi:DNA invertase Pin-like site-specific DNA recombinase
MPKVSKNQLLALQKKLTTDEAIGKKFGVTRQAIHQLRKKYGIASNYAKNPERNRKIIVLYKKVAPGTAIAKKTGLSVTQTYRIINAAFSKKSRKHKRNVV